MSVNESISWRLEELTIEVPPVAAPQPPPRRDVNVEFAAWSPDKRAGAAEWLRMLANELL